MKKLLRDRRGVTLVEQVVTFTLLALFSAAAVMMISSSLAVFRSATLRMDAQTLSQIILDKVAGEIGGAQVGVTAQTQGGGEGGGITIDNNEKIKFYTRTGSPVIIGMKDNRLVIRYLQVVVGGTANENQIKLKQVDWTFDDAVYKGFQLDSLTFSHEGSNVIRVSIKLTQGSYSYEAERYVRCFNFTSDYFAKIQPGTITLETPAGGSKAGN